jgi:hypothetical protein
MLNNLKKRLELLKQEQTGRFLFSQLTHTMITLSVLALLLVGARQVGALNRVLAPAAQTVGDSFSTINYQGRLADNSGQPEDGTFAMSFAIYDAATDGNLIWGPEEHTVEVSDGLFSVGLGSKTSGGIPTSVWRGDRYLEISVNNEALAPRELLRSAPVTQMALDVAAGTITSTHLMNGAVTTEKLNLMEGKLGVGTDDPQGKFQVVGGDVRVGLRKYDADDAGTPGYGRKLFFSGGPHTAYPDFNSDNSDGLWLVRYNVARDETELRVNIGDNSSSTDALVIGYTNNGTWHPVHRFQLDGGYSTSSAIARTENSSGQGTTRLTDEGVATLTDGSARVALDPVFLETVADDFHIHLTPYGDASLYVAEVGADYFVVESQEEGADVDFAWLLTATREGYEGVRLESAGEEE